MLLKSCRCGKLIPQSVKMCEECEQRQQSRHMIYNNTRRDKRAAEFYVSKEWRAMRERIIEVYDNVDIYALYVENELLTCEPVHHIVELEDDWEQRLNPFNLIPLNHKTHNTITALYKQSFSTHILTRRMTAILNKIFSFKIKLYIHYNILFAIFYIYNSILYPFSSRYFIIRAYSIKMLVMKIPRSSLPITTAGIGILPSAECPFNQRSK